MDEVWLIVETSGRVGKLGLTRGERVIHSVELDATRRHARDLAATVAKLLQAESLVAKQLTGIMVSTGPGSYTGLRVGIMSAKALAFALDCSLIAVPTFAAIAKRAPSEGKPLWVIADALKGQVYCQRFAAGSADKLRIVSFEVWQAELSEGDDVTGPGVNLYADRISQKGRLLPEAVRDATVESVFAAGRESALLCREELFALEPLYLRGSSAEEKWNATRCAPSTP